MSDDDNGVDNVASKSQKLNIYLDDEISNAKTETLQEELKKRQKAKDYTVTLWGSYRPRRFLWRHIMNEDPSEWKSIHYSISI